MGAPKIDEQLSQDIVTKKITIAGFSKAGREKELERQKHRLDNLGWRLQEYHDGGISDSYAIFEGEKGKAKEGVTFKKLVEVTVGFTVLIVIGFVAIGVGVAIFSPADEKRETEAKLSELNEVQDNSAKIRFSDDSIKLAVDGIKEYPVVVDAAVTQKGTEINLVVVVRRSTNLKTAQEMGDNFLRMLIANSMGVENSPQKEIGSTRFSYLVGVYYPDETQVAIGAKAPAARKITW